MTTSTAPRHLHGAADDRGRDKQDEDRPSQTAPVAILIVGFAILAFAIFMLSCEGAGYFNAPPAVIMSLMTCFGVSVMVAATLWSARWILHRVRKLCEETAAGRAETAAARAEFQAYSKERFAMIATTRGELANAVAEIKDLRATIEGLTERLDEAVDAGIVSSVNGALNGTSKSGLRVAPNRS